MFTRVTIIACLVLVVCPPAVSAQEQGFYVGGAFALHVQPHSDIEPLGGKTWGGSVVVGKQMSSRVGLEVETYFSGEFSDEYSYNPGPSWSAHVVARRRDTFFSVQLRSRVASYLEPVVGVSYVLERPSRHATVLGTPYFDDSETRSGLAAVGGLDAPIKLASRVYLVPTFRVFLTTLRGADDDVHDPLGWDTKTGRVAVRLGVGVRWGF
jgi:hypothetical protein